IPLRALVAGLRFSRIRSNPGMVNTPGPFLLSSRLISPDRASKTSAICFLVKSVFSASSWKTADLLMAFLALGVLFSAIDLLGKEPVGDAEKHNNGERRKPARDC